MRKMCKECEYRKECDPILNVYNNKPFYQYKMKTTYKDDKVCRYISDMQRLREEKAMARLTKTMPSVSADEAAAKYKRDIEYFDEWLKSKIKTQSVPRWMRCIAI